MATDKHYALGPVKPWVQIAGDSLGTKFGITTEYGVAARVGESDHPLGLAIDFMVYTDKAKGDALSADVQNNAAFLGVTYIIWQQHIWDIVRASEGWRLMPDRGSPTANHMDHVHVSFQSTDPGSYQLQGPQHNVLPGVPDPLGSLSGLKDVLAWMGTGHNWYRVFLVLAGVALVGMALFKFSGVDAAGTAAAIGKVAK